MRLLVSFILALVVSTPAGATLSPGQNPQFIVPSLRIGRALVGMSRPVIDAVNRTALCPVSATYDPSGRAMSLQTNWGGGCLISDKIQVGLFAGPVLRTFGRPARIYEDPRYPQVTAYWLVYEDRGVAFRILGWFPNAIIQTIAVFNPFGAARSGREPAFITHSYPARDGRGGGQR